MTIPGRSPLCAIIPAHDEVRTVAAVVTGVRRFLSDVLVIDDGSRDGTSDAARASGAHCIRHERCLGKGRALRSGFIWARNAGFESVVTLDGDGQHDPADIPRLVEAGEHADLVVGYRTFDLGRVPVFRVLGNRMSAAAVSRLAGRSFRDSQCGFRWIRRALLDRIELRADGFEMETELLVRASRLGLRILEIPVKTIYGLPGSDFRFVRDSALFTLRCFLLVNGRRRDWLRWQARTVSCPAPSSRPSTVPGTPSRAQS
jgi:glycosyltransferase involved in cell wall biosynthesis